MSKKYILVCSPSHALKSLKAFLAMEQPLPARLSMNWHVDFEDERGVGLQGLQMQPDTN